MAAVSVSSSQTTPSFELSPEQALALSKNIPRFFKAIEKVGVVFFLREGVRDAFCQVDLDQDEFAEFNAIFLRKWIDFYREPRKTNKVWSDFSKNFEGLITLFGKMPGERRFVRGLFQMIVDDPKAYIPGVKRISALFLEKITPPSSPLSPASLYEEEYN